MNVERLRKVRATILSKPQYFDMSDWGRYDEEVCGTVCCIGGYAALDARMVRIKKIREEWGVFSSLEVTEKGRKATADENDCAGKAWLDPVYRVSLGLTVEESERLFLDENWPSVFKRPFQNSESRRERARIAAKRITHFIKSKGRE